MITVKTAKEFIQRLKEKKTVSRFEIELGFKWNMENSKILSYADLINADLSYADLINADLSNADLSNANLSNADLSYADLSNADLIYADLSNANLSNADLRNANLRNADLRNAEGTFIFNFGVKLKIEEKVKEWQ